MEPSVWVHKILITYTYRENTVIPFRLVISPIFKQIALQLMVVTDSPSMLKKRADSSSVSVTDVVPSLD